MTPSEVLIAIARADFRWPTELEREMFPGCESNSWMIASLNNYVTAIIDGDFIEIYKGEEINKYQLFDLSDLIKIL